MRTTPRLRSRRRRNAGPARQEARRTGRRCCVAPAAGGTTSPHAARRNCEWEVIDALDRLATRSGGGGPAYGDAATYIWRLPGGSAEWSRGMFGAHGVWINGIEPLLLVCEILKLRPPRFATRAQGAAATDVLREIREQHRVHENPD